jgi:hypothetical protein
MRHLLGVLGVLAAGVVLAFSDAMGFKEVGIMEIKAGVHTVRIYAVYCRKTYGEYLEGDLGTMNREIVKNAPKAMAKLWGPRRTVVFRPVQDPLRLDREILPEWQVAVWLESDWVPNDENEGTHLVIEFFADHILDSTIADVVADRIRNFDWEGNAEGFNW